MCPSSNGAEAAGDLLAASLTCKESFADGLCGSPATHIAGLGFGGYLACPRCADFWNGSEYVHELTPAERACVLVGVRLATEWWT